MRKQLAFAQLGATAPRIGALALGLVICTLRPGLCASAQHGAIVNFDVPGCFTTFGGDDRGILR